MLAAFFIICTCCCCCGRDEGVFTFSLAYIISLLAPLLLLFAFVALRSGGRRFGTDEEDVGRYGVFSSFSC